MTDERPLQEPRQTALSAVNVVVLGGVLAAALGLLASEGAFVLVPWQTWALTAPLLLAALAYAAFELSFKRHLFTLGLAIGVGYLTPLAFASEPASHSGALFYGVMAVLAHGVTTRMFGPYIRPKLASVYRSPNVVLVLIAAGLCAFALGDVASWPVAVLLYALFLAVGLHALWIVDPGTLLSVFLASLVVGFSGKLLGLFGGLPAMLSPPPPLLSDLGRFPLTFGLAYGVSAVLARESPIAKIRYFTETRLFEEHRQHVMWSAGKAHKVATVSEAKDRFAALEEVLEKAGFWPHLEQAQRSSGKDVQDFMVVIKPNLMFMYSEIDRSTFTDPSLVEHLIDRLRERGYRAIFVVEAQSAYGNYFEGRGVENVARVAGYQPKERYTIVDLTEEMVPHTYKAPLGEHFVGKTWRDADYRISFAKNKTHTWAWYTLTIKNVYGALPMQDKLAEYHYRREIYYPTIDACIDFPVHFGIVDAWESADGPFGIFADKEPNATHTMLAGSNLLAVDWVGATKMGIDPMRSRFMQLAVQAFGKPMIDLDGDLTVYPGFRVPSKDLIDFWDHAEETYTFTNTAFALLNHDYMSKEFARKPMSLWMTVLSKLFSPLGGVVYRSPRDKK